MSNYKPTMSRDSVKEFAAEILDGIATGEDVFFADTDSTKHVVQTCRKWARKCGKIETRGTWGWYFERFAKHVESGKMPHAIISEKGNIKLPFYSWSTLADFTCPGAGDCLKYCYTFTGWRYPGPVLRQLQNTILIRHQRGPIRESFRAIPAGRTLRLYVDGDIENPGQLAFWFGLLNQRPDVKAYGYSKSWEVFIALENTKLPNNYVLNISNGSRYDGDDILRDRVSKMPITRGEFVAVDIGQRGENWWIKSDKRWESPEYHNTVRTELRAKHNVPNPFSCPGKCGSCLPNGDHACGSINFPVLIGLGTHG